MKFLKWKRDNLSASREWLAKSCIDGFYYEIQKLTNFSRDMYELRIVDCMSGPGRAPSGAQFCYDMEANEIPELCRGTLHLVKFYAQFFDNNLNSRFNKESQFLMTIKTVKKFFGKCEGLKIENIHPYG